jgi:uncharacterized membrane protein YdjX (TVP38/TMEM64 family)
VRRVRRPEITFTLLGVAAIVALTLGVPPVREAVGHALQGDTAAMRAEMQGPAGVLVLEGVALAHIVTPYPTEVLDAVAGYVFGFWWGLLLVHTGWIVTGVITYFIGAHLGRPAIRRLAGDHRVDRAEALLERGGIPALLAGRLIPLVPFSFFSAFAGAMRVPLWRYTWTTAVGYLPLTAFATLIGSRLEEFHPTDPLLLGGSLGIVALLALSAVIARRVRAAPAPPRP